MASPRPTTVVLVRLPVASTSITERSPIMMVYVSCRIVFLFQVTTYPVIFIGCISGLLDYSGLLTY